MKKLSMILTQAPESNVASDQQPCHASDTVFINATNGCDHTDSAGRVELENQRAEEMARRKESNERLERVDDIFQRWLHLMGGPQP